MSEPPSPRRQGVRWWPAVVIIALVIVRCLYVWYAQGAVRQYRVMGMAAAGLLGAVLLVLWWVFASRVRWKTRLLGLGVGVACLLVLGGSLRYEGVTGDLVPIFRFRWQPRAREATVPVVAVAERPRPGTGAAFPQFLGPTRDGVIHGVRLVRDWAAHPPVLLWRQPVGQGWGGTAVAEGRALTQEQDGPDELVTCYELETGRRLWAHRNPARYDNPIGGIGPRATPTVVGKRVYALGATGVLNCLDLDRGEVIWTTNIVGEVGSEALEWGVSSSPLVISNLVVVGPRGAGERSLAAYGANDGALVWAGGSAPAHYSSPRLESPLGFPQILTFTSAGVAGHDPASGAVLWSYPWRGGHPHVTDPRLIGSNQVLIASGYGTGSQLVELGRSASGEWTATNRLWKSMGLKSKFANLLIRDAFAYGLDDGRLTCLALADGSRKWEGERLGHGQLLLLVGDVILVTAENGDVVLVEANPDACRELTRFRAVEGKTWNPPALAGDVLVVRNDREAAAYRLPVEP